MTLIEYIRVRNHFYFSFFAPFRRRKYQKAKPAMASPKVADPASIFVLLFFLFSEEVLAPCWDVFSKIWPSRASFLKRLSSAKNLASRGSTQSSVIYSPSLVSEIFMIKDTICVTYSELIWTRNPESERYDGRSGDST